MTKAKWRCPTNQNKKYSQFAVGFWARLATNNTEDELRKVDASPPFASALRWFLLQRFPCFAAYSCRFFHGGPLDRK